MIVFVPTFNAIFPEGSPDVTGVPFIVTTPEETVGIRLIDSIPLPRDTAYVPCEVEKVGTKEPLDINKLVNVGVGTELAVAAEGEVADLD